MSSAYCDNMAGMVAIVDRQIPFIPITDLKHLLSVYFLTPYDMLLKRDNRDTLQGAKAITYDGDDCGPTTGQSLFEKLQWADVKSVITALEDQTVAVSGVQYQGRYAYVLACWVHREDPTVAENIEQFGPVPTRKNTESALKAFLKEIKVYL